MDKDTVRILVLLIGLLVIVGMIVWSFFKHEKAKREFDSYDGPLSNKNPVGSDDFDIIPLGKGYADEHENSEHDNYDYADELSTARLDPISKTAASMPDKMPVPDIIQFSIVSQHEDGFNGVDLFEVMQEAGLEYGNLQIFERLDNKRLVDFGVANLVKPGTFPSINLGSFYCPGIVFFMQPKNLPYPHIVFEDFIRTFTFVAERLDGIMWDQHRELLTDQTIEQIRQSL